MQAYEVDPRVRGGDIVTGETMLPGAGRSPRARGRLPDTPQQQVVGGSIPACAGETYADS